MEQQTAEVYKAIEEKMNTAADKRDENIKKMLERLREHVSFFYRFLFYFLKYFIFTILCQVMCMGELYFFSHIGYAICFCYLMF